VQSATSAVFNLVHRDFAPLADRLRSVIARERQIPMLLAAGKANIEHPPRAFVDIAIRNVAGSIDFLKTGTPAAFAAVEDQDLKREFAASNDSAIAAFENYESYLDAKRLGLDNPSRAELGIFPGRPWLGRVQSALRARPQATSDGVCGKISHD
jgi:hypothetical protein